MNSRSRSILSPAGRQALRRLASSEPLLVFDYDGTLAPIVADPRRATIPRSTRALLARLCKRYRCALVTGRARAQAAALVSGIGFSAIVGNHGMEMLRLDPSMRGHLARVARWKAELARAFRESGSCIHLEDKRFSLSLHFRGCPDTGAARRRILRAMASFRGKRVIPGKLVFNLMPAGAPDKGVAVGRLAAATRVRDVFFVGDDRTDEDVFRMKRNGVRLLGVHVGTGPSRARWRLPDQRGIDRLLRELLSLSAPPRAPSRNKRSRRSRRTLHL